jgi:hypothetical protein
MMTGLAYLPLYNYYLRVSFRPDQNNGGRKTWSVFFLPLDL